MYVIDVCPRMEVVCQGLVCPHSKRSDLCELQEPLPHYRIPCMTKGLLCAGHMYV